ncbi:MAG: glycogen synthase GlgA [Candidatus Omnitrophica bacterium]|nr:glycogen synthase GlgA [Candidatus Omnitrophota bacterium]
MRILFVASEVAPFAKTGGLGDVAGALPKALKALGHDVRVVMPRYRAVNPARYALKTRLKSVPVTVGSTETDIALLEGTLPGTAIPVYFVEQPDWFDRDGLYQQDGDDFPDNLERFSGLTQAVLHSAPRLRWRPDVVHCHDWQTALLCAHLALTRRTDAYWSRVGSVLTIHNLAYQGVFPRAQFPLTNLPPAAFSVDGMEFYGKVNCLKGGLLYADRLATVSPTYAQEIQSKEFGAGLEGVLALRRHELAGILNGIDLEEWNPATDPLLPARYTADSLEGKARCRSALRQDQGLAEEPALLIGLVQRLVEQKGLDLLVEAAESLMALPIQLVILGTGERTYQERLTALARRYPKRIALNLRFDNGLAHRIEAGADAFLMPSRFEPCGLNQLYSMRYGTVPIVRKVGGLADTVVHLSPSTLSQGTATGIVFEPYTAEALLEAVERAVEAFRNRAAWERLIRQGMRADFSWARSAEAYIQCYAEASKVLRPAPVQRAARGRPARRPRARH